MSLNRTVTVTFETFYKYKLLPQHKFARSISSDPSFVDLLWVGRKPEE